MSARQTYRITALAGAWIAGYRRPAGPTILLTPEEAEYDLRVGTIEPTNPPPPAPTPTRLLLEDGDHLRTLRGSSERNIVVEALEGFLTREGSVLAEYIAGRADEIGIAIAAAVDRQMGSKAPRLSPVFEGTPTAPTAAPGTSSQQIASTAFVTAFVAGALAALGLGTASRANTGTAAGNVPVLDTGGKLLAGLLPAIAVTDTFEVASQAEMLALANARAGDARLPAERGDVAVRSDLSRAFILKAEPASTLANWVELKTPADAVLAVAGLTGAITAADLRTALALAITDISGLGLALGNRLRVDAAQGLNTAQIAQALTNLGLGSTGSLSIQSLRTTGAGDNDYYKAQALLSGGGSVSWVGNRLAWTRRFVAASMARNATYPGGYIDIVQPIGSIPAGQVYDGVARDITAAGIFLGAFEALWFAHTVGGSVSAGTYRITRYTNATEVPANWILVASVNGDDLTLRLGSGQILRLGQTRDFSLKEPYAIAEVTGLQAALDGKLALLSNTSFRNRIINGDFRINQRGAAAASTAYPAGAYIMDRWKAGANGVTLSFAVSAGDVTVTITAGTLVQVIEGGFYMPDAGVYMLSWKGTAQARVYQSGNPGYNNSPIATGLGGGTNTTIEFGTGTISQAQFEFSTVATAFERRDDELQRSQRYFRRVFKPVMQGIATSATLVNRLRLGLEGPMRATPSAVFSNVFAYDGANGALITAVAASYSTKETVDVDAESSGLTAQRPIITIANPGGYLDLSAEL